MMLTIFDVDTLAFCPLSGGIDGFDHPGSWFGHPEPDDLGASLIAACASPCEHKRASQQH